MLAVRSAMDHLSPEQNVGCSPPSNAEAETPSRRPGTVRFVCLVSQHHGRESWYHQPSGSHVFSRFRPEYANHTSFLRVVVLCENKNVPITPVHSAAPRPRPTSAVSKVSTTDTPEERGTTDVSDVDLGPCLKELMSRQSWWSVCQTASCSL